MEREVEEELTNGIQHNGQGLSFAMLREVVEEHVVPTETTKTVWGGVSTRTVSMEREVEEELTNGIQHNYQEPSILVLRDSVKKFKVPTETPKNGMSGFCAVSEKKS